MICRKGIVKGGVFHEFNSTLSFRPICNKGESLPEGVPLFLNLDQQVIVINYLLVER